MILEVALSQYGITEIKGSDHNPEVMKYYHDIGHTWVDDDETPWCSAFANWVAMKSMSIRPNKLNARSWLDVGLPTDTPAPGDIVVFWRDKKDSWKGHVGFFVRMNDDAVWCLGGNQGIGQVNIRPYARSRVLGFRKI